MLRVDTLSGIVLHMDARNAYALFPFVAHDVQIAVLAQRQFKL